MATRGPNNVKVKALDIFGNLKAVEENLEKVDSESAIDCLDNVTAARLVGTGGLEGLRRQTAIARQSPLN